MKKRMRRIICLSIVLCMALALMACGKECANGCGEKPNSKCMAEMCDQCCAYWLGMNGCYADH